MCKRKLHASCTLPLAVCASRTAQRCLSRTQATTATTYNTTCIAVTHLCVGSLQRDRYMFVRSLHVCAVVTYLCERYISLWIVDSL